VTFFYLSLDIALVSEELVILQQVVVHDAATRRLVLVLRRLVEPHTLDHGTSRAYVLRNWGKRCYVYNTLKHTREKQKSRELLHFQTEFLIHRVHILCN